VLALILAAACQRSDSQLVSPDDTGGAATGPPTLVVTRPARAAFTGRSQVELVGQVIDGGSPIAEVEYNGEPITAAGDGSFNVQLYERYGINLVDVRAEDEAQESAIETVSFHAGPTHAPGEQLSRALRAQLSADLVDDIGSLAGGVLSDDSLADSFEGLQQKTEYASITPTSITWAGAFVELELEEDLVVATIVLTDIVVDMDVTGVDWYDWIGTTAQATMSSATIYSELAVSSQGGQVTVDTEQTTAGLSGYAISIDWFPDTFEDDVADWTRGLIEDQVAGLLQDTLGSLISGLMDAFALDLDLGSGVSVTLSAADVDVSNAGILLSLHGQIAAPSGAWPDGAGSLDKDTTAPSFPLANGARFALAADEDFANQFLFALWGAGAMSGISLSAEDLGEVEVPPPLGPITSVDIAMDLPPVLQFNDGEELAELGIGELLVDLNRTDGSLIQLAVGLICPVDLVIEDDAVTLAWQTAELDLTVGVPVVPEGLSAPSLAALGRVTVPVVLSVSEGYVDGFPLPSFDLGASTGLEALQGVVLTPTDITLSEGGEGWLLLSGDLDGL